MVANRRHLANDRWFGSCRTARSERWPQPAAKHLNGREPVASGGPRAWIAISKSRAGAPDGKSHPRTRTQILSRGRCPCKLQTWRSRLR